MVAIVLDTGRVEVSGAWAGTRLEIAVCGECGWRSPERVFRLFGWRVEDDARRHNDSAHTFH